MRAMSLFNPGSVAVIGASSDEKKVGHLILRNLLTQGYKGKVFPVNPKGGTILGCAVFPTIHAIPDDIDLAVIATPAAMAPALAEDCGKRGVEFLVVIGSGFRETGAAGLKIERDLQRVVERYSMKLVGPNSLGFMRPGIGLNASFAPRMPEPGPVALISQSGALADAFIDRSASIGLKISLFVSLGNKTAMNECDLLEYCERDERTRVVGLYLEGIVDGRRFLSLAQRIVRTKPIVLLKGGITERGRLAASSHTGALAGSDAAVEAICAQSGIRRARTTREFLDLLRTLSQQPPLLTDRIAVITNAGGPGVLASDAADRERLILPSLSPRRASALQQSLPPSASVQNPIDVLGDALADRYASALQTSIEDPNVDGALVIVTPQEMTPARAIAEMVVHVQARHPLFPILGCFMGGESVHEAVTVLHAHGIPNFSCPESALHAFAGLRPVTLPSGGRPIASQAGRRAKANAILRSAGRGLLSVKKTEELFTLYRLPLPDAAMAKTADSAVRVARSIGYPVTAKISSKDILHKTDVGGVMLHLASDQQVRCAFDEILRSVRKKAPRAHIDGVLIQQSLPPGTEFIIGTVKDDSVGQLVMAGLGGIFTEFFRDAAFRVAPVSSEEAYRQILSLKSHALLQGQRGKPPLDIDAFARALSSVSRLVTECPQIREIDLNPVLVTEKGLMILDAKVVV